MGRGGYRRAVRFSHTTVYVNRVAETLAFWERAFGVEPRLVDPGGDYAELDTGGTRLAFVSHRWVVTLFDASYRESDADRRPIGVEVGFEVGDVDAAVERAAAAGARVLAEPVDRPGGGRVARVRDGDGLIVALSSPTPPGDPRNPPPAGPPGPPGPPA